MVAFRNLKHAAKDRTLEKSVEQTLLNHDPFRFRRVTVRARSGVVVLMGSVSGYYAKALGFNLVQRLPDVASVIDAITVTLPGEPRSLDALEDL